MSTPAKPHKKRKCRSRGASARRQKNKDIARSTQGQSSGMQSEPSSPKKASNKTNTPTKNLIDSACNLVSSSKKSRKRSGKGLQLSEASDIKKETSSQSSNSQPLNETVNGRTCSTPNVISIDKPLNSVEFNIHTGEPSKMVSEDERMKALSSLLERLTCQYSVKSSTSNPVKVVNIDIKAVRKEEGSADALPTNLIKKKECETIPDVENDLAAEGANLTAEEKQALRKARKEAKKLKKTDKSVQLPSTSKPDTVKNEAKPEKSKAELREERRLKQEAQRAAKAQKQADESKQNVAAKVVDKVVPNKETPVVIKKTRKVEDSSKHIPLLGHLVVNEQSQQVNEIHPAIRLLGNQMKELVIDGCTSRVLSLLQAVSTFIEDYNTPPNCDLSRDLVEKLQPNFQFLNACRSFTEPINNVISFIKKRINDISPSLPEERAKEDLQAAINTFIHQNIVIASKAITINVKKVIDDGEVILTYGFSSLFIDIMEKACSEKRNLSVVVADKPDPPSGMNMLQKLASLGVSAHYRLLPDLASIMKKVTKVIFEAEAVVLNGAIVGPCGIAGLALMASTYSIPVVAFSHSFKFCSIDMTDSLVINELGNASKMLHSLKDTNDDLNAVKLVYDVTPTQLVNTLVTEQGPFQCSVVPVIIERFYGDILGRD